MLRRIGLSNFKCWKELDIELAPITLLFGANSSGKTTVLQSLLMLKQTARSFDPGQHINFGGTDRDYVDLGSYQDVVYGHDTGVKLGVRLSWIPTATTYHITAGSKRQGHRLKSVTYHVAWKYEEHISIDRLRYDMELEDAPDVWVEVSRDATAAYRMVSSSDPTIEIGEASSPRNCYLLPKAVVFRSWNDSRPGLLHPNSDFEDFIHKIQYIGPIRSRPERHYLWTGGRPEIIEPDGANAVQALIAADREGGRLANQVEVLLKQMELVDALGIRTIDKNNRLYQVTARIGDADNALVDVGFGVSQVLPVVALLFSAPNGSIVLLEQPELHLHPNAQAALADLLLDVAETRNLQLIVESHSEHIVRRFQRRIAEASPSFATPENIKMYYCQPGEAGSMIEEVGVDRFGQISNWPEKFMGDISGDLHTMLKAALERRSQELESVASGG